MFRHLHYCKRQWQGFYFPKTCKITALRNKKTNMAQTVVSKINIFYVVAQRPFGFPFSFRGRWLKTLRTKIQLTDSSWKIHVDLFPPTNTWLAHWLVVFAHEMPNGWEMYHLVGGLPIATRNFQTLFSENWERLKLEFTITVGGYQKVLHLYGIFDEKCSSYCLHAPIFFRSFHPTHKNPMITSYVKVCTSPL